MRTNTKLGTLRSITVSARLSIKGAYNTIIKDFNHSTSAQWMFEQPQLIGLYRGRHNQVDIPKVTELQAKVLSLQVFSEIASCRFSSALQVKNEGRKQQQHRTRWSSHIINVFKVKVMLKKRSPTILASLMLNYCLLSCQDNSTLIFYLCQPILTLHHGQGYWNEHEHICSTSVSCWRQGNAKVSVVRFNFIFLNLKNMSLEPKKAIHTFHLDTKSMIGKQVLLTRLHMCVFTWNHNSKWRLLKTPDWSRTCYGLPLQQV